jgi:hypothetical protein
LARRVIFDSEHTCHRPLFALAESKAGGLDPRRRKYRVVDVEDPGALVMDIVQEPKARIARHKAGSALFCKIVRTALDGVFGRA